MLGREAPEAALAALRAGGTLSYQSPETARTPKASSKIDPGRYTLYGTLMASATARSHWWKKGKVSG